MYLASTMSTVSVPSGTDSLITSGYYASGDGGHGLYMRVASNPNVGAGGFQSLDGQWWKLVPEADVVRLEQFGGKADWNGHTGFDNYQAFLDAFALITVYSGPAFQAVTDQPAGQGGWAKGARVLLRAGSYFVGSELDLRKSVEIIGHDSAQNDSSASTALVFPADCRGITINNRHTAAGGYTETLLDSAEGTRLQGISVASLGGSDATKCGIWMRGRGSLVDVSVYGFPGNGVQIIASAGLPDQRYGNANGWNIDGLFVKDVGGHGLYVNLTDANAGIARRVNIVSCGLCGVWDADTLGNTYTGIEIDDWDSKRVGGCLFNGSEYLCLHPTGTSNSPAVEPASWYKTGSTTSYYPAYSSATLYRRAMPIAATGLSNGSRFEGATYTEGGISDIGATPATATNGNAGWTTNSNAMSGTFYAGTVFKGGLGVFRQSDSITYKVSVAYDNASTEIWGHTQTSDNGDSIGKGWAYRYAGADLLYEYSVGTGRIAYGVTGPRSSRSFGGVGAKALTVFLSRLGLADLSGDPYGNPNGIIITSASAKPLVGDFSQGSIILNRSASAGGYAGWICTATGIIASNAFITGTYYSQGDLVTSDGKSWVLAVNNVISGYPAQTPPTGTADFMDGPLLWRTSGPFTLKGFGQIEN